VPSAGGLPGGTGRVQINRHPGEPQTIWGEWKKLRGGRPGSRRWGQPGSHDAGLSPVSDPNSAHCWICRERPQRTDPRIFCPRPPAGRRLQVDLLAHIARTDCEASAAGQSLLYVRGRNRHLPGPGETHWRRTAASIAKPHRSVCRRRSGGWVTTAHMPALRASWWCAGWPLVGYNNAGKSSFSMSHHSRGRGRVLAETLLPLLVSHLATAGLHQPAAPASGYNAHRHGGVHPGAPPTGCWKPSRSTLEGNPVRPDGFA